MSFNQKLNYEFNDNNSSCTIFSDTNIKIANIEKNINNELFIIKSNLETKEDVQVESSTKINGIILGYNLLGYSEHKGRNSKYNLKLATDESYMSIIKDENSISSGAKGLSNKMLFIIKKEFIEKNINDNKIKDFVLSSLEKDICQDLIFKRKTNEYLKLIIQDLYKLNFDEGLNNLYIQSRILELLFLELNTLTQKQSISQRPLKLDEQDIEAIKKAKDILLFNMQNPPSIIELSRMVAINDFKLKKGFKEIFGTTPYELLLDYRLELSKKLLQEGVMNINEISNYIGYKHTQSFSKAFIKKYGIQPKKLMKNRKYYY